MLIENSNKLGGIPRCIANRLVSISTTSLIDHDRGRHNNRDKRRHRRSSSFNRKGFSTGIDLKIYDSIRSHTLKFKGFLRVYAKLSESKAISRRQSNSCLIADPNQPQI